MPLIHIYIFVQLYKWHRARIMMNTPCASRRINTNQVNEYTRLHCSLVPSATRAYTHTFTPEKETLDLSTHSFSFSDFVCRCVFQMEFRMSNGVHHICKTMLWTQNSNEIHRSHVDLISGAKWSCSLFFIVMLNSVIDYICTQKPNKRMQQKRFNNRRTRQDRKKKHFLQRNSKSSHKHQQEQKKRVSLRIVSLLPHSFTWDSWRYYRKRKNRWKKMRYSAHSIENVWMCAQVHYR